MKLTFAHGLVVGTVVTGLILGQMFGYIDLRPMAAWGAELLADLAS